MWVCGPWSTFNGRHLFFKLIHIFSKTRCCWLKVQSGFYMQLNILDASLFDNVGLNHERQWNYPTVSFWTRTFFGWCWFICWPQSRFNGWRLLLESKQFDFTIFSFLKKVGAVNRDCLFAMSGGVYDGICMHSSTRSHFSRYRCTHACSHTHTHLHCQDGRTNHAKDDSPGAPQEDTLLNPSHNLSHQWWSLTHLGLLAMGGTYFW